MSGISCTSINGDEDVFDSILKPWIIRSPLPIGKDTNFKESDDFSPYSCLFSDGLLE